ncbi:hypothetical protein AB835_09615 [Candidatus Endobugula sertula]|uniref:Uncharacterized protein n=1 Tax=Candidatus Endobugula sertula TaxID=62101 RepID=A0A1D2QNV8_9GAMM|nr:hypothetical protein AB835_09615 [Candidatus Endobugula sertula]
MYIKCEAENLRGCFPCFYEYQTGKCGEYHWVLVRQPVIEGEHEYIGMRTEQIATEIYFKELSHVDPINVRFIEYYPPEDFSGNVYPEGYAEMLIPMSFSKPFLLKWIPKWKGNFIGYSDTPRAHKPPFDDAKSFFSERGIFI